MNPCGESLSPGQILLEYCGKSLLIVNVLLAQSMLPAASFGRGMGQVLNWEEKDLLENGGFASLFQF